MIDYDGHSRWGAPFRWAQTEQCTRSRTEKAGFKTMHAVRLWELTNDFSVGFWRPRPLLAIEGITPDVAWSVVLETGRLPGTPPLDPVGHGHLLYPSMRTVGVSPEPPLSLLPNESPRVATP